MVEGLPANFSFIILLINILQLPAGFYLDGVILWFVINLYFGPFPQFLAHSYRKPWNYLSNKNNGNMICYNIWSLSHFLKSLLSYKGEMSVLLFISAFQPHLSLSVSWLLEIP